MKKKMFLSMVFLSILFCGCKKDEAVVVLPTTLQIVNGFSAPSSSSMSLDFTPLLYCYNSKGDLIQTINQTNTIMHGATSTKIEVQSDVEKIRIYIIGTTNRNLNNYSSFYTSNIVSYSSYVQTYFYLTKSANTTITIDKNTVVSNTIWP